MSKEGGADADEGLVMSRHASEVLQFIVPVAGTSLDTEDYVPIEQHAPIKTQPACVTGDSDSGPSTHTYRIKSFEDRQQSVSTTVL